MADPGTLNVAQPDFVKQINQMVKETPIPDWKTYLRWRVIDANAAISARFRNRKLLQQRRDQWDQGDEAALEACAFSYG
jgi:predicted metalloendopeptidase